ncbi:citrate lyase holo-[acyl-carrier protein] synthase [Vagococcus zengguangii]|uniref:citrate lyase holo-[acyl-carrier protein] synthase n=1 Tax=Vagococcus zengguangii TaxID=2571750 RepID=A0A4D7CT46_9ENTE|nr:citrate lyase holo-[acyl-carrier protein] synthase [Vagococcus zengguangii]QCI85591.1 citrate lyase holo-[acyl-carrier protein] synthase [Vagococcus zengguangii]TLG79446.1 citrate lyase holo-[acyl-carrier protein] synthase [Vagococcus zengguangii]
MLLEMCENNIFEGQKVSLIEMLDCREKRVYKQTELLENYPNNTLICATLNLPGEVKNNDFWSEAFIRHTDFLIDESFSNKICAGKVDLLKTGPERLIVVDESPIKTKEILIAFENKQKIGRLFDLDVIYLEDSQLKQVSRQDLGLPPRKCFICEDVAKNCSRSRKHSIIEMQQEMVNWL